MSSRTTSGEVWAISSSAVGPSAASPITSRPSASSRKVRNPRRTAGWSSTISTRIGSGGDVTGHLQAHHGARAGRGADGDRAAYRARSFAQRAQAQAAAGPQDRLDVEAGAVVGHLED